MSTPKAIKTDRLISIAIATYNGEKYLRKQLDSIYQQTYQTIEVVVTDDRSTDATPQILEEYHQKYGLRYYINEQNLGFLKNFEKAISLCKGDYIALSDQDDVWLNNKLERELDCLLEIEHNLGKQAPILIFSDLYIVDPNLEIISDSFYSSKHFDPSRTAYNQLLVENIVLGCTFLFNRSLKDIALPIPDNAIYHDHWLVVISSIFGEVQFLSEKTLYYRQHDLNSVGTKLGGEGNQGWNTLKRVLKLIILNDKYFKLSFEQRFRLANEVSKLKGLPQDAYETCNFFGNMKNFSFFERKRNLFKRKLLHYKTINQLEMLLKL